jgi:hypothetical protein
MRSVEKPDVVVVANAVRDIGLKIVKLILSECAVGFCVSISVFVWHLKG